MPQGKNDILGLFAIGLHRNDIQGNAYNKIHQFHWNIKTFKFQMLSSLSCIIV